MGGHVRRVRAIMPQPDHTQDGNQRVVTYHLDAVPDFYSPDFIAEMSRLGYRNVPADKLVQMRIHGVTPDFIRGLQKEGIALPSPDQIVRLRLSGYRPGNR